MWRTIIVALALICLGLLGYYAVSKRAVQISASLAADANKAVGAKVAGVSVLVDQRDARLVGSVSSDALRADAERAAAAVSGLRSVKNELVVEAVPAQPDEPKGPEAPPTPPTIDVPETKPPEPTTAAAPDAPDTPDTIAGPDDDVAPADTELAAAPLTLDIAWDGTLLVAKGSLPEGLRKDIALSFVSDFPDATIKDEIVVTSDAGTPELARAMKTAVAALGRLQSGKVVVDGEDFEINGVAASVDDESAVKKLVGDEVKTLASTVTLTVAGAAPADPAVPPPVDVPADGPLTTAQCQVAIDTLLEGPERITFKGPTGRIDEAGELKIQAVFALLQRCPDAKGQIIGFHDHLGEPDRVKQLSAIRAFNVYKRLQELGMDKARFKFSGVGQRDFKYPNKGDTRVLNQRIEFRLEVQ